MTAFFFLHAQGSCYFESRCKEQKEQLAEPAGVKTIQPPDLLVFVRKEGKRREVLRMHQGRSRRVGGFKAIISITREEKFCQTDKFRNEI